MIPLSLLEVAAITGGRLHGVAAQDAGALIVDGPVVTDSREAAPGSLYVARIGESADGHRFVGPAGDLGAVAALVSREVVELPCIVVEDVQAAFAALARAVIERLPQLTVVAITGSSGKTSTKDLLGSVLAAHSETVASAGSYNGEVGVPLTVLRVTPTTRFLVVEMGARGAGHIEYLTTIAPPDIAIVLNVGIAHLGEFGSKEAVGRAKAELVRALTGDGVAVLNVDDPVVAAMASGTGARVLPVGRSDAASVRTTDVSLDAAGRPTFTVVTPAGRAEVSLRLHGEHHVGNALAVVATALECGLELPDITAALAEAAPVSRWRMEVTERADGVTVVNDAYNANPDSMRAALRALAAMSQGRRAWAVLGAMLELGESSDAEHESVGRLATKAGTARLLVVGETALPMLAGARAAGAGEQVTTWVPDTGTAYELLSRELREGDVVLLKSSRDAGLRWLGDRLTGQMEVPS